MRIRAPTEFINLPPVAAGTKRCRARHRNYACCVLRVAILEEVSRAYSGDSARMRDAGVGVSPYVHAQNAVLPPYGHVWKYGRIVTRATIHSFYVA